MILNLSQLRADFKAVYKENWKLSRKLEILIEATKIDFKYQHIDNLTGKKIALSAVLNSGNISLRTLQRWKKLYKENGLDGVRAKPRGHKIQEQLTNQIKDKIQYYRRNFRWGSEVIQAHLVRDEGHEVTRYKIERYLDDSKLKLRYPCTTKKKTKAKKKRHTKKVYVKDPGTHTQMDVKYQTHLLTNGEKAYVYNFIDHASNWSFKYAYSRISALNTKDFMERLIKECPFQITRLQTDNGIEFTYKWASKNPDDPKEHPLFKLCAKKGITHKLIPPGEKELQGLVERSHRQDDQELFSRISPKDIYEFNELLKGYYKFRNRGRRFKKLHWKSPDSWLELYYIPVLAEIFFLKNRSKQTDKWAA
ncbi:MAG: transposase [Bacteriovoracaceae bacterium]|jgi:transposase